MAKYELSLLCPRAQKALKWTLSENNLSAFFTSYLYLPGIVTNNSVTLTKNAFTNYENFLLYKLVPFNVDSSTCFGAM